MSQLSTAVCSITPTKRRRFFWAAWWTGAPSYAPFRKPDAANGGARTREEALREAQSVAARQLTLVDPHWARAWQSVLRGEAPTAPGEPAQRPKSQGSPSDAARAGVSAWSLLGLAPGASPTEVKRAFRKRALETHPDQGGDPESFLAVQRAYEKLNARRARGSRS